MNKIENYFYNFLKHHPMLKMRIRNLYMDILDIVPDKPSTFSGELICKEGFFFGFHDQSPFSYNDKYVLSNKIFISHRMPKKTDSIGVGYWDHSFKKFNMVARSYSWNYHKGCRLQWLNNIDFKFIFNNVIKDKLISQIKEVNNTSTVTIDYPIDSISPDGKLASSFSYERLEKLMPGYGYLFKDEAFINDNSPNETGLFIIDLNTNTRKLIFSLKKLASLKVNKTMIGARHFVTHTLFSPDSKQIAFLHRWIHNDVTKRFSRLIICNLDGTGIKIAPTDGMVSHYVWDDKNGLLAYCRIKNKDGHYLFRKPFFTNYKGIAINILNSDGHQHFIPHTNYFVTDTYPNQRRYAKLLLVNIRTESVTEIANIKSFKKFQTRNPFKHWACDLHPRINKSGNIVSFDSVHSMTRSICFLKINLHS